MLGLVTCHFNPNRYRRIRENYFRFRDALRYPLVTVELAFDDDPFVIEDSIKIRGTRERHCMWQKERLLNIGIQSLDPEFDKVCWVDADLLFLNPDWLQETEQKLDEFPVVQPFQGVIDLDSNGAYDRREIGFAYAKHAHGEKEIGFRRPGGAWAMRRDIIPDGIFDRGILGSGDALQMFAWTGDWRAWHLKQMPPTFRKQFLEWGWSHWQRVRFNIGYTSGDAVHVYHGKRADRHYSDRNRWLVESDFNMDDVRVDENGLLTWASDKPPLRQRCAEYFPKRREDDAG